MLSLLSPPLAPEQRRTATLWVAHIERVCTPAYTLFSTRRRNGRQQPAMVLNISDGPLVAGAVSGFYTQTPTEA